MKEHLDNLISLGVGLLDKINEINRKRAKAIDSYDFKTADELEKEYKKTKEALEKVRELKIFISNQIK